MRRKRLVAKLLPNLKQVAAFITLILVKRHKNRLVFFLRAAIQNRMAAVARYDRSACAVRQLRDRRFPGYQFNRLLEEIVLSILWRGARDRIAVLIVLGRIIVFRQLDRW